MNKLKQLLCGIFTGHRITADTLACFRDEEKRVVIFTNICENCGKRITTAASYDSIGMPKLKEKSNDL